MAKISSSTNLNILYSSYDFDEKIKKINNDLNTGKMWLNKDCKTIQKNSKIVRFIKSLLSIILPLNLYSGIKANKAALNLFKMVETNKDHLKNSEIKNNVIAIFFKLNISTKKRYTDLFNVLTLATKQLSKNGDKSSLIDDTETLDNDSIDDNASVSSSDFSDSDNDSKPFVVSPDKDPLTESNPLDEDPVISSDIDDAASDNSGEAVKKKD